MRDFIYVGIGASAGGLHALEILIQYLPKNVGYTYIIAQHLDPKKQSDLSHILAQNSPLPVSNVDKNCNFLPNHIYVIPSSYNLVYTSSRLMLKKISSNSHKPVPSVNELFNALAFYKRENAVAIVLTGLGYDGSDGAIKIKELGGITIAQSPSEAEHPSMPKNAIDTGAISYILRLKEIAEHLFSIITMQHNIKGKSSPSALKKISHLLYEKENIDIYKYKIDMIMRRITKRITMLHFNNIDYYLNYIMEHKEEIFLLYKEILIHVTSFFRDKEMFIALKNNLHDYLRNKPNNYNVRIWSIGCSSGEEPYSLAILIDLIALELNKTFKVHIFATDIDDIALKRARDGIYSQEDVINIDKLWLKNYFIKKQEFYKIKPFIREQVIFTHHNILSDPPFIDQDMISCRNLLIYFNINTQREIFSLCYSSLKRDGRLFLGLSEAIAINMKHFIEVDSKAKIYKKQLSLNPPKISTRYFTKKIEQNKEMKFTKAKKDNLKNIEKIVSHEIFNFFAPNFIIIDQNYFIVYKKGNLPFIKMPDGLVSLNILDNMHKDIRYDLEKLLVKVFSSKTVSETKFIEIKLNESVTILVKIIAFLFYTKDNDISVILYFQQINFQDIEFFVKDSILRDSSLLDKSLLVQLQRAKDEYQTLSERSILHKENMQLLNEELQSSNEELQSSTEEMETSNEELKTSNEQLQNLNDKLAISLSQISQLQNKLSLILNSTRDGILGIDMKGNATFINTAATKLLGFTQKELLGKNAHKLWHHTKADGTPYLPKECVQYIALKQGVPHIGEDLYWRRDGSSFEVSVIQTPIIENDKTIGAVIAFHDITEQNRLTKLANREHQLATLVMNIDKSISMTLDLNGNIDMISVQGAKLLKAKQSQLIGKNFFDNFLSHDVAQKVIKVFKDVISGVAPVVSHYKNALIDTKKQEHIIAWTNSILRDTNNNIKGLITSGVDITQEEFLSKQLYMQEHIYKMTFEQINIGIVHIGLDTVLIDSNPYVSILLGYTQSELKQLSTADVTFTDDFDKEIDLISQLIDNKRQEYRIEKRFVTKSGKIIWAEVTGILIKDKNDKPLYILKTLQDISEKKILMLQLQAEQLMLKDIIEFMPIPVMIYNEDGKIILVNQEFSNLTEYDVKSFSTVKELASHFCPSKEREKRSLEFYLSAFKTYKLQSHERTTTTKSGKQKNVISSAIQLRNHYENNKKLAIFTVLDITDMRNNEEIMISQSRQAAMGDMLSMIAHQWRQPLGVIAMSANNIHAMLDLQQNIKPKTLQSFISIIDEQTQYLSHTVDDFRDFFKPDKEKEEVTITTILNKLNSLVAKALETHNILLKLPKDGNIKIKTYQNQLIQVLLNIVNNAKDAIKDNNLNNKLIKITIKEHQGTIILSICDNGGGIDKSVMDNLAQPYVTTKGKNGTGLGLYMSKIIVTKHLDGELNWYNVEDGACFDIILNKEN